MRRARGALLAAGLAFGSMLALAVGESARRSLGDARVCERVGARDFAAALEASTLRERAPASLLVCRCEARHALREPGRCTDELLAWSDSARDELAAVPASLLVQSIRDLVSRGADEPAARLAERAASAHPGDLALFELEVATRSRREGSAAALLQIEARRSAAARTALPFAIRLRLARHYSELADYAAALRALGEQPPAPGDRHFATWFHARTHSLAELGRIRELQASFARWQALGGSPAELAAHYALRLSFANRSDPEHPTVELLARAIEREREIADPELRMWLYDRLISHLVVAGQIDAALAAYDASVGKLELIGITREQIERSADARRMFVDTNQRQLERGELVFHIAGARRGATLLVSSVASAPADAEFESHAVVPGAEIRIARAAARWPERWVYRDADGNARASGAAWISAGSEIGVAVNVGAAAPARDYRPAARRPGDGRRRVLALVLDCADWRVTQYLRARRELPFLDFALESGSRAVLRMEPALTAAAMEALVWPQRERAASVLATVHQLGLELAGLASVGRNPFAGAALLLPPRRSLFEQVGAGERVAVNLLFSHSGIDAGRHAEMIGPRGARRHAPTGAARRPLSPRELDEFPGLRADRRSREQVETIAAELDTALRYAEPGEPADLVLLRIEPLDILTHGLFAEHLATAQDDGKGTLLDVYRHLDRRLSEVYDRLDGDDVLVAMSDHGIRNAMEHETDALFVAVGDGLSAGRAAGTPELAGVPFALLALLEQRPGDVANPLLASLEATPARGEAAARRDRIADSE